MLGRTDLSSLMALFQPAMADDIYGDWTSPSPEVTSLNESFQSEPLDVQALLKQFMDMIQPQWQEPSEDFRKMAARRAIGLLGASIMSAPDMATGFGQGVAMHNQGLQEMMEREQQRLDLRSREDALSKYRAMSAMDISDMFGDDDREARALREALLSHPLAKDPAYSALIDSAGLDVVALRAIQRSFVERSLPEDPGNWRVHIGPEGATPYRASPEGTVELGEVNTGIRGSEPSPYSYTTPIVSGGRLRRLPPDAEIPEDATSVPDALRPPPTKAEVINSVTKSINDIAETFPIPSGLELANYLNPVEHYPQYKIFGNDANKILEDLAYKRIEIEDTVRQLIARFVRKDPQKLTPQDIELFLSYYTGE